MFVIDIKKMPDPKKGTGKKPKGSGRRLYTDENPKDTVSIKYASVQDARDTVAKVKRTRKRSYCKRSEKLGNDRMKANYWARRDWDC